MKNLSWISLLFCISFILPPPQCFCQPKVKTQTATPQKEDKPSTYAFLKNKTLNMFSLIAAYIGLESYFKRKKEEQARHTQKPGAGPKTRQSPRKPLE